MELHELTAEKQWRLCRGPDDADTDQLVDAFVYFCENYWYIKHPERGRIKFELREAQVDTIRCWMENRYSIVLKARQIGFSTLAAAYAFWLCYFWNDRFVVMLSRTEREAAKLLAKSKYGYKYLPTWMHERGPRQVGQNLLKLAFENDSSIESLPSGNDPARGESVYLVIVDEWAFLPDPEEAWASIEPIADVGGRVIGLSTANGSGNFFHSMWVGSQTGANHFQGIFFPWSAGDRDDNWYEIKQRQMPDWQLHQEYPRSAEEAFIKSGNPVFDIDALMRIIPSRPTRGYLWVLQKKQAEFRETDDGEMAVWKMPEAGSVYVLGADVAEGLGHGDFSVAQVIEARTLDVVANWHGRIAPDLFGELIAEIGWWYNGCLVGVENNNHGLTTLKALQNYGYHNLFRQRRISGRRPVEQDILGWRTTAATKPLAIDELAAAVRDAELGLLDERTVAELKTYVRDDKGKTHGSPHDDRVMSLAIGYQMLKYVWLPEYKPEMPVVPYSLSWFEKFVVKDGLETTRTPIGAHSVRFR